MFILTSSICVQAQIAEVKTEGSYARIYNDKGAYSGYSVYLGSDKTLAGYNGQFLVIKEKPYARIYNAKGTYTGNSIYLGSANYIKNVSTTVILIKEGNQIRYYDYQGHYTGTSTYESK